MQTFGKLRASFLFLFTGLLLSSGVAIEKISASPELLKHEVDGGKYHRGGNLTLQILESKEDKVIVQIDYVLKKKRWYPIPSKVLKGTDTLELPAIFASEEGYKELKEKGSITLEKATVNFIQNVDYKGYYDCYQISVLPSKGDWKGIFLYHPDIPSVGWAKADITFYDVPVIKSYRMTSQVID